MKQRDLEIIEAALQTVERPDYVVDVTIRLDDDWSGDPAAMIRLLLKDEIAKSASGLKEVLSYQSLLKDAVFATEVGRWPYIDVWTETERLESEMDKPKRVHRRPIAA